MYGLLKGYVDFQGATGGQWWDLTLCLNISNTGTFYDGNGYSCTFISGMGSEDNVKYPMSVTTFFTTNTPILIYMFARSLGSNRFFCTNKSIIRALRIA